MLVGEHGIGPTPREYPPLALEGPQIEVARLFREAVEPHRTLDAGRVFLQGGKPRETGRFLGEMTIVWANTQSR
jgi:hypothetical protein